MSFGATKLLSASGSKGAYEIDQSLMFNDGDSAYLTRTPSSAGNLRTWTLSFWVKRSTLGVFQILYSASNSGSGATDYGIIYFDANDALGFYYDSSTIALTNRKFRDVGAWYHIYIFLDTTASSTGDRWGIYINGVNQSSWSEYNHPSQNTDIAWNNNIPHYIGRTHGGYYFDGYIAEFHNIDGTVKPHTNFGETDSETGQWIPKKYGGGSYGTTGFYLKFVSGALGTDSSGSSNTWTANNLANADVLLDTPTNNFPTLNPLMGNGASGITLTQGNLKAAQSSLTSDTAKAYSTIGLISGKWYAEVSCSAANVYSGHGVVNASQSSENFDFSSSTNNVSAFTWGDRIFKNGSQTQSGTANTASGSNILGIALNLDDGTVQFYSNGSTTGSAETLTRNTGDIFVFCDAAESGGYASTSAYEWNYGQNGTHSGTKTAGGNTDGNGIGNFVNAVPSGFLAPCTSNLADPAIKLPTENFNTVIYTGSDDDAVSQNVTGVGHQPDLVWIKKRNGEAHHVLTDAVRGVTKTLNSNQTVAEVDDTYGVTAFGSDGFTVREQASAGGQTNTGTLVSWNWKANGSGSANTDGATNTTATSANTTAGFSIVDVVGTGSSTTYGHGLGVVPKVYIVKLTSGTGSWYVQTSALDGGWDYMVLNTDATSASMTATAPTSSVITGNITNTATAIYYAWAEVEGFSKFDTYTGNGSTDGPYVYTGFRPGFVMYKRTNDLPGKSGEAGRWQVLDTKRDPFNVADTGVSWNSAFVENSGSGYWDIDILSNGFKLRTTEVETNGSGGVFFYMAFAESPFKYANAR